MTIPNAKEISNSVLQIQDLYETAELLNSMIRDAVDAGYTVNLSLQTRFSSPNVAYQQIKAVVSLVFDPNDHCYLVCEEGDSKKALSIDEKQKLAKTRMDQFGFTETQKSFIFADWSNWEEHLDWLLTASKKQIVSWVDTGKK